MGEIDNLLGRDWRHHVGHAAIIAVAAVVLVLGKGLGEIVLALVGDARDVFFPRQIGVVTGVAAVLLHQRLAALQPRRLAGFTGFRGGVGFGILAMKSEKRRRSSSVNPFAISFIGSKVRSFMDSLALDRLLPLLDTDGAVTRRYSVLELPQTFFIDAQGVIRHIEHGAVLDDAAVRRGIDKAR